VTAQAVRPSVWERMKSSRWSADGAGSGLSFEVVRKCQEFSGRPVRELRASQAAGPATPFGWHEDTLAPLALGVSSRPGSPSGR
jgi:hypothetical protein